MQATSRKTIAWPLAATLITSAIHFADNAFRLNMYPGSSNFTRNGVLAAWLLLPLLAWAAYRSGSKPALLAYAVLGFAGLLHFIAPHSRPMMPSCVATVFGEALASVVLICYVVTHHENSESS